MRLGNLILSAALISVLVAGCATAQSGTAFNESAAAAFTEGSTKRQDVEAQLGKPTSITTTSDGRTILVYTHVQSHANGFTGKGTATARSAAFVFDASGKLLSKNLTSSDSTTRAQ